MLSTMSKQYNAVVCDLDGTILHVGKEAISVPGRTRASFLSADAAELLAKISYIFPLIIATGRNAKSVSKLVKQLPDVRFRGFVLENGFVVKNRVDAAPTSNMEAGAKNNSSSINDKVIDPLEYEKKEDWNKIASLFINWERLPFYENCVGFVFNFSQSDFDSMAIDEKVEQTKKILAENGYSYPVYKEKRKVFIYPGHVDKMRGLKILGAHPYIAIGDGVNDLQMMQQSTIPVMLDSGAEELKEVVKQKNGFCSNKIGHDAACEMLEFTYKLLL